MMIGKRNRGFKLGRKLIRGFKWIIRRRSKLSKYEKLEKSKTISRLCNWGRKIKRGLLNSVATRGYVRVGHDSVIDSKPIHIPKGHLAVHVEEPEGDTRRVLVPILFLNHPLFGKLLEEAENVYGFDHPGRITIPCPISEFENVQMRIAAGNRKCLPRPGGYCPNNNISGAKCLFL
ncbi:auxin-responsive protein SAUR36-like [Amaranthus tricolor]|uniref:auxin-responsive protein SAUR36-like n=1 Tax=Amaranthus tricolor TaxID=29722 RepID=UPI002590A622|nr:auxin-responsive protein SAUR36-like [Amaranthus tricolor]